MGFFRSLTSVNKPQSPKVSRASESRIKNILGITQLEALPAHAARAFQLASDPKSKTADFVRIIESDEALSARVIRVANSVYFYRGTPANDIEKAVANIGLDELRCLLSATMLRNLLQGKSSIRKQVWANSVATATFARGLSRTITSISSGEAFLCGLVHDVGKLVMLRRAPDLYERVIARVGSSSVDFISAEEEVFELNHVEVGQWVAQTWSFPAAILEGVAGHHRPLPTDGRLLREGRNLAAIVRGADVMAHAAGIGHPAGFAAFRKAAIEESERFAVLLGWSTADTERFIQTYTRKFESTLALYEAEGS